MNRIYKNDKNNKKGREFYNIDLAYPFFCAIVAAAFICVFALFPAIAARLNFPQGQEWQTAGESDAIPPEAADVPVNTPTKAPAESFPPALRHSLTAATAPQGADKILEAYRDPASRDYVTAFFGEITQSLEVAQIILANADIYGIPPALAFALCWEESRFKVRAVNRKNRNNTTDRGLFQLNDKSFPKLSENEFFDPQTNSYYGLSHLRLCLDTAGSLVAGLAMYNAGTVRVKADGTPKRTLDYVSNIMDSKQRLETLFEEHRWEPAALALGVEEEETAKIEEQPAPFQKPRMAFLSPTW
jgi:soluble lytic murein transglycosylase-like protein